jgi:hypothetical protein
MSRVAGRREVAAAVVALAILSMAPAARGETPQDKAKSLAKAAEVMYGEGRLDQALPLFLKAYELDPAPALLYNIARIHDKKGELARAREYYEKYVALETDVERQSKGRVKLEAVLDRIPGRLVVESDPPGATMEVDGRPVTAGRPVEVRRGSHDVSGRMDRYQPSKRIVEVAPGGETRVKLEMRPLPGNLVVNCEVKGARVTVNGTDTRTTPLDRPYVLPPGRHVVEVTAAGYEKTVAVAQVEGGVTAVVDIALKVLPKPPAPSPVAPPPVTAPVARKPAPTAVSEPALLALPAVSEKAPASYSPWSWISLGTGAALVVTGGVMTALAGVERGKVDDAATWPDGTVKAGSMTRLEALSIESKANQMSDASIGLYAVGGVAVVTGVILAILDATSPRSRASADLPVGSSPLAFSAYATPGGGALVGATGSF